MADSIDIQSISADQTCDLRLRVLRPNETRDDCIYPGDGDASTVHFGALEGGEIVGIASLYAENQEGLNADGAWRIRGMATDPDVRGQGFGKRLVERCIGHALEHDAGLVWCNARSTALEFYRRLGFVVIGDEFEIPGIGPHFLMERGLK